MRQRGFSLILYAVAALAVIGALGGLYYKVSNDGYQRGKGEIQGRWDEANRQAEEAAAKVRATREAEAKKASVALQQSERKASDYEQKWRESARKASGSTLAVCAPTTIPQPGNAPSAPVASPDGGLRLTLDFGLRWDAAWTDKIGEPIWPDPGDVAGRATTPAAAPAEVLQNHAENAFRCDQNRRQLTELIALIRRLRK